MAESTDRQYDPQHDSGKTSDSPKSGFGGKHSTDAPTTPRTDAGKLLGRKPR